MSLQRSIIRTARARPSTLVSTPLSSILQPAIQRCYSSAPVPATIVSAGFWKSLVPKFLRKEYRQELKARRTKEWNPATFFIVIFLCIGSMSIQMITLRNSFERHMRQTEVRIGLLKDVVERIQRGETVDVEKALGTGEPKKEADWEEVLKQIEKDDAARKASKQEKAKRAAEAQAQAEAEALAKSRPAETPKEAPSAGSTSSKPKTASLGSFF